MNESTDTRYGDVGEAPPEAMIAQLVRDAGPRVTPPAAIEQQNYRVVHEAWLTDVHDRQHRMRRRNGLLAASVIFAAVIGAWIWQSTPISRSIAMVAEIHGAARQRHGGEGPSSVSVGASVAVGDELVAAPGSNLLLRRDSGLTVLLGPATRVKWTSADELNLIAGVLYVDTNATNAADDRRDNLTIITSAGRISHVGTQFSVDARSDQVLVAVRSGVVRVKTRGGEGRISRGEEARIAASGAIHTERLAIGDTSGSAAPLGPWTWLTLSETQFAIENRPLSEVVRDIADASGLEVQFASPALEHEAQSLVLHGPALSLEPMAALNAVLLTTQLQADRHENSVRIALRP
jgi:ferric-dicitrate binding protein FerR (iron transport regulator)